MNDYRREPRVENLPDLVLGTATPCAPAPKFQERRTLRRAKLRLRMRARPGEFDDGAFQEVASTLDVSRKAFYFVTPSDRYRPEMRLRVDFPYDPEAHAGQDDFLGEVVRVLKTAKGYGVAVVFWKPGDEPSASIPCKIAREKDRGDAERRRYGRHAIVTPVELTDLPTGMRTRATTLDLSLGGCYVNTLNPHRLGAKLGVEIEGANATLEIRATVRSRFEGVGMGLAFENVSAEQLSTIADWLTAADAAFAESAT